MTESQQKVAQAESPWYFHLRTVLCVCVCVSGQQHEFARQFTKVELNKSNSQIH